jgi:hypothetical protein
MVSVEDTIPWAQDSDGINREKKRNPRAQAALLLFVMMWVAMIFPLSIIDWKL